MRKVALLIIALIFLSGCWITPPIPNETVYRAFLVGVGRYENGWTLPSPESNVEQLAFLLLDCKFGEEET